MWVSFDYSGKIDIPFDEIKANPLLIVRKLPRVETITKMGDMDYHVVLKPFKFHGALVVVGKGHIKLSVIDDTVVWQESEHHCNESCNGKITGVASRAADGSTEISGTIAMNHAWVNRMTWGFAKPLIEATGIGFMQEFITNFRDTNFYNSIPEVISNGS